MKTIDCLNDVASVEEILGNIQGRSANITLWQKTESNSRVQFLARLTGYTTSIDLNFQLVSIPSGIDHASPLFFYSQKEEVIFKTSILHFDEQSRHLKTQFPAELKSLQVEVSANNVDAGAYTATAFDSEVNLVSGEVPELERHIVGKVQGTEKLNEKEVLKKDISRVAVTKFEEKMWQSHREAPRVKTKEGKHVTLKKLGEGSSDEYPLYDLSQGGMAFVIKTNFGFEKDDQIEVVAIDGKNLDVPLVGKVASVRPLADTREFKVGVMFVGGQ